MSCFPVRLVQMGIRNGLICHDFLALRLCFRISEKAFTARYEKWCKRKGYHFRAEKAAEIYAQSCELFVTLPKDDNTKLLITTAAQQLLAGKMTLAALRAEMTRLAQQLPEYDTVRAMYGVGETTAAQLMAEIGDVRRFPRRSSIVAFAGVESGYYPVRQARGAKYRYDETRLTTSEKNTVPDRLHLSEKIAGR